MPRPLLCSIKSLLAVAVATVAFAAMAGTALAGTPGAVYIQTNSAPNAVKVFYRSADGALAPGPTVPTGGAGSAATGNPPFGLAVTDSQNSVVLTQDNRVLLVSNNMSNTVTTFRVLPGGTIAFADQQASRGEFPNSIAVTNTGTGRTLVYVLNENSETVTGFTLDRQGNLTPIPGSERHVSGAFSATVGFDWSGHVLTVTNRNDVVGAMSGPNGSISTFAVDPSTGLLGPELKNPATGTGGPFGFEYTKRGQLLVANSGQFLTGLVGSASSYDLDKQTAALAPRDTKAVGAITCWVAVTNNNQYVYYTSPGTLDVTGFHITPESQLVPIGKWQTPGSPLDEDTSVNSQYLYVLNTDIDFMTFAFSDSRVTAFKIDNDTGQLAPIGTTPAGSGGNSGLASY